MLFTRPTTWTAALTHLIAKRVLPTVFSSLELERELPASVAERAFFSARTTLTGYLQQGQALIARLVQPAVIAQADGTLRKAGRGESINPAKVRTLMQQHLRDLGYEPEPGKKGKLTDLSSDRRVSLIVNMQTAQARGYARDRSVQTDAILKTFPADRLYRALPRRQKRDWQSRWNNARASLGSGTQATRATSQIGPYVAPKNDPIWPAISRFGTPYPPFDYMSGMRKRSVSASQAKQYGITAPPKPVRDPLSGGLSTRLRPNTGKPMLAAILKLFPGSTVTKGILKWTGTTP